MPIRWSALKVSAATDMIEGFINQAAEPLEQARIVAREARKIDNLPEYVNQNFTRLLSEIDRAIGGSRLESVGRMRSVIEGIRKAIPQGAIAKEAASLKNGKQQALI